MRRRPPRLALRRVWGWSALAAIALVVTAAASAAPVLRSAVVEVRFLSSTTCQVALTSAVEGATEVEHRIEVAPGTEVELVGLRRASMARPPTDVGRTRAVVVRPAAGDYALDYRVSLPSDRAHRCPLWLPAIPADGRTSNVRIYVTIPDGARPAGTMPAFTWNDSLGAAGVGHLPSFVLVPFAAAGAPRPWNVSRVMDALAVATLVLASLLWLQQARVRQARAALAQADVRG